MRGIKSGSLGVDGPVLCCGVCCCCLCLVSYLRPSCFGSLVGSCSVGGVLYGSVEDDMCVSV